MADLIHLTCSYLVAENRIKLIVVKATNSNVICCFGITCFYRSMQTSFMALNSPSASFLLLMTKTSLKRQFLARKTSRRASQKRSRHLRGSGRRNGKGGFNQCCLGQRTSCLSSAGLPLTRFNSCIAYSATSRQLGCRKQGE